MATPTTVYKLYDGAGVLLYVGITSRGMGRLGEHLHERDWWGRVASTKFEHYPERGAALQRERTIIQAESPIYNVAHNRPASKRIGRPLGKEYPVKALREALQMVQEEFTQAIGVSLGTVYSWESGRSRPSKLAVQELQHMARQIGFSGEVAA